MDQSWDNNRPLAGSGPDSDPASSPPTEPAHDISHFIELAVSTYPQLPRPELISNIPVFTLETEQTEQIVRIIATLGDRAVIRIINALFVQDALQFGTDKGHIERFDYRRLSPFSGWDVWGVENKARSMGLTKADVFCGCPGQLFCRDLSVEQYKSLAFGIPEDRSAILIFDSTKVQQVEGTDGYIFLDPANKRDALLGIIRFHFKLNDIDRGLQACGSVDDQIEFLENEAFNNLNTAKDLERIPYIAAKLVELLYWESLTPSPAQSTRIDKVAAIGKRLDYERVMIEFCDNMTQHLDWTREAFQRNDLRDMAFRATWPDFVIETTETLLADHAQELDRKYVDRLREIIADAKQCKKDLGL